MMEDKFKLIKTLFANVFEEEAKKINKQFEDLIAAIYIYPPRDENRSVGCALGLDVVLHKADSDKADSICLEIYVREKEGKVIMTVDIVWGHPTGKIVGSVFVKDTEVIKDNLAILKEKLPDFFSKFQDIIRDNPNGV